MMTVTHPPATTERRRAAAFAEDAAPLLDALARRARRLCACDADAEDLLQDTLLYAFQGYATFRPGTNFKAWLFRILHNRWVSNHRYRESRPSEVMADPCGVSSLADLVARPSAVRRSAEAEVLDDIPHDDVCAALATLPAGVATVMYHVLVEGRTHAETAQLVNVPLGTVMSRVARGRERLRLALSHHAGAPGRRPITPRRRSA